ncbi:Malonyl-[acyl-carrier protein] O-methyltransferase [Pseudoalteromonas holothuriae]|uniref:Malonyl-[acyl-carrier protein] O-methyltransferase n=1 Tax=Pseudoalteromonas holothuriae TaxID=2963714 RepID=A0A9W4VRQ4_9GAMM|nr:MULTISPECIES: methyltransferase domain-containing protein [unclassified Pseudoalteromonas]CAH9058331.1 Malonyl-[acyl-carrier protein] O-methyltransferase [Pseudoalteromonas sp. CIP111854]CAH9058338.1 Malonyl-[acyl-carrier protein] O-methyltransferase [Pseudoalteromonas sp. CIP111951]
MNAIAKNVGLSNSMVKQNTAERFSKAAKQYKTHARVQQQVASRLFLLLENGQDCLLDLGAGPLLHRGQLIKHAASVLHIDLSHGMLQQGQSDTWRVCADMDKLPLQSASVSCIFSNFAIQWSSAPAQLFKELARVCKPDAQVVISSVLDGSLKEISQAWRSLDNRCHVNSFLALHELEQFAKDAGFGINLSKQACLKDSFENPQQALKSVKNIGANQMQNQNNKQFGLMGKKRYEKLLSGYPLENNQALVSYEVAIMDLIKL